MASLATEPVAVVEIVGVPAGVAAEEDEVDPFSLSILGFLWNGNGCPLFFCSILTSMMNPGPSALAKSYGLSCMHSASIIKLSTASVLTHKVGR